MKTTYTYAILRYVHDPSTAEFVNVGVVLYAPEAHFAGAICRTNFERLSGMFPDFDGLAFRSLMRFVQSEFRRINEEWQQTDLLRQAPKSVMTLAHSVLPPSDNSYRWSEPAGGTTDYPEGALQKIFARMVSHYDEPREEGGRSDADVRSQLEQAFAQRGVRKFMHPKVIEAPNEQWPFPLAYKNGLWNCVDGISFDLTQPESIKNKARRWLGLAVALSKSPEAFQLNLIVAEPNHPDRSQAKAIQQAFGLLEEMPGTHRLIREDGIREFSEHLAHEIKAHESGA